MILGRVDRIRSDRVGAELLKVGYISSARCLVGERINIAGLRPKSTRVYGRGERKKTHIGARIAIGTDAGLISYSLDEELCAIALEEEFGTLEIHKT